MTVSDVIKELKKVSDASRLSGMSSFGIDVSKAIGVSIPNVRALAKKIKTNHSLALQLWDTEIHEARILASMIADSKQVTKSLFNKWVADFNSWDLCDQTCGNLLDKTPFAIDKAIEFSKNKREYVKRAGFVLMAALAVHDKKADDAVFINFLPIIQREANDERNFVRKAVNWALRQIGKRNKKLNRAALLCAESILTQESKSAKWIATDAIRELKSKKF
ncbi:MAG: DNA alkylation repair protein [Bacteroidetes bacterium]|nr:DNA alkylation repair protein [Bacteroidota bacterium]